MQTTLLSLTPTLIVEDDIAMQQRLSLLVGDVEAGAEVSAAASLAEARELLAKQAFALVLVDLGLPDGNGGELIAWLHRHRSQTLVVVISAWGHEDTVLAALRAGAIGYLLKERENIELSLSLRSIRRGGAPIDPAIAQRILTQLLQRSPPSDFSLPDTSESSSSELPSPTLHLSEREHEVLGLIARGCSNRDIASALSLSTLTIEGYTKCIYRKLAVNSRTAAVFEARSQGLLK